MYKRQEIHLTTKDKEDMITTLINYPPEKKTSMLQDLEAGRKTEIDYFGGTVIKLGEECGAVSYTHLDVYKRQSLYDTRKFNYDE